MDTTLTCDVCGELFIGRSNRKHCSLKCRRDLERKRRYWNNIEKYITMCEKNALREHLSERIREEWRMRAVAARERRENIFGLRP